MVEPVTTAAATHAATQAAGQVAQTAMNSGGNFFGDLIGSFFKAPGAILSGVFGSLFNGALLTAGIMAIKTFAMPLWRMLLNTIDPSGKMAHDAAMKINNTNGHTGESGMAGMLLDSALEGFGASAALGGAGNLISEGMGAGLGGMIGTVVFAGVLGAITLGAIHPEGIKLAGDSKGGPTPPPTPKNTNKNELVKN